jgi:ribosomal protein L35AE/L33A
MISLIYRLVKGTPLTNAEVDSNFSQLAGAVQPAGGTAGQILAKVDGTDYNSTWTDNFALAVKVYVKNATGATLTKGTAVYVSGATGGNVLVAKAQANAEPTSAQTLGILEADIANGASGFVFREGILGNLDTSAANDGDPVYLSPSVAGGLVYGLANKPSAPNHLVYMGTVQRAHAVNGEIQVRVQNGFELEELHNVAIASVADLDILSYDAATSTWKNYTPGSARTRLSVPSIAESQAYATSMAIALG